MAGRQRDRGAAVSVLTGPEAYGRAVDLLEQAFATRLSPYALESGEQNLVPVLPPDERAIYIEAAKAYAGLAQVAALMDQVGQAHNGQVTTGWAEVLG